jgi:sigma-B regulation protein RsbU (phosphoserine phosphatase)
VELDETPLTVKVGEGVVGQAAAERRPILVVDTQAEPMYVPIDPHVRSELAVPVIYREQLLGILNLESVEPAAYDESDTEIMTSLVSNLGSVISNLQLVGQIRQQVERQQQILDITNKIRQSVDIQTILETSASELARALKARKAAIQVTTDIIEKPLTSELGAKHNGKERHS